MIILIDNYDSFSYNLYQLAGSLYPDIKVIRNDALSLPELEEMNPKALLISPGPDVRKTQASAWMPSVSSAPAFPF